MDYKKFNSNSWVKVWYTEPDYVTLKWAKVCDDGDLMIYSRRYRPSKGEWFYSTQRSWNPSKVENPDIIEILDKAMASR